MYSPKISEDLIPLLYAIKRWTRKPMTVIVDEILREEVQKRYQKVVSEETAFFDAEALERRMG